MRIALVTTFPPGGGSLNEYAFHVVRSLRQKPEVSEVLLLVDELPAGQSYPPDDETPGLAPLRYRPCWRFETLGNALRIRRMVRQLQPDALLFNIQFASFGRGKLAGALGLAAPLLAKTLGLPVVVLLHNLMDTVDLKSAGFTGNPLVERVIRAAGTLATRLLLRADLVAVTMPKYVELLEGRYGATNAILAPHGAFDEGVLPPTFELPPGPLRILTFGKFGTYKKVDTLIEAFQLLAKRSADPLELVIAGTDSPNTPGYLASVQERYNHVAGLRFTGYVPEEAVAPLFHEAAMVVIPYTSTTGSSGVLHQAGRSGRAVVLPRLGDLADLIAEEGYSGVFFEPENAWSLAEAMAKLIDDPTYRQELAQRNYAAARGLPMSDVVDWYLLHFQTLLHQRAPAPAIAQPDVALAKPQVALTKPQSAQSRK
ncbi:MAG: glycosyltransferase [Chloroflexaceae bacterium]|nr:glycosyltransferase [Chloroflexaceae bacterium]